MPGRQPGRQKRRSSQPLQRKNIQTLMPCGVGVCCVSAGGASGSSCARMRAEAATGRNAQTAEVEPAAARLRSFTESSAYQITTASPINAPSYREEMRERSGSHGRRRYALRQGQRLPAADPAQPEPQNQPRQQTGLMRLGKGATSPSPSSRRPDCHSVHIAPLRPASGRYSPPPELSGLWRYRLPGQICPRHLTIR